MLLFKCRLFFVLIFFNANYFFSTSNRQLAISSLTFGVSQSVIYFVYIATFNFGAYLIDQGEMDFLNVLR